MTPQTNKTPTAPADPGPGKNPLLWLRERLAELRAPRAAPAVRLPRRARIAPMRVSWLSSFWSARQAVRSGIAVEDFLQHRLSQRVAALPVPPARLPVAITVEERGAILTVTQQPQARRAPWLESFLRAEGAAALAPEIQLAQADVARLAARLEGQRRRVDELGRELEDATRGQELADPADEAQAAQMGRPPVPPPVGFGLQLFGLALLLAETWQLAVPCLEAAGIRTLDLQAELHRNPVGLVLGGVFALGASASLFLFAHLALRRGRDLFGEQPGRRRLWAGLAATGALALAVSMAWSIAGMRPGASHPVNLEYARVTLFLVALAIPLTTAWLMQLAKRMGEERGEALARARAWDHEHYRSFAELSRRAAALGEEERRLMRLEAERLLAVRRLRALQQRSISAERVAADAADEEEQELARLGQAIAASLELDRYEYVRQSAARGLPVEHRPLSGPPVGPNTPPPVRRGDVGHGLGLAS
ncbi:hypothetical protein [Anaeromyxobacter diazotrophicus]|uniref:Uncharacterized protein n=1 Tax=Anaeromyxobacter diazotrophicus TaxID=2590199 RepID=A0A7I9VQ71_9BACT|nr:hypothetical protein [Anaeromyxobacter diazotrophicus]GEJ58545.1 hypothetical protein AMYX_32860 [Anaeromyxobacter diazotrophicus]